MTRIIQLLIIGFAIILNSFSYSQTNKTPEIGIEIEKASYSLGVQVALSVKKDKLVIEPNAIEKAFKDVFEGNELVISEEESMEVLQAFGKHDALSLEETEKVSYSLGVFLASRTKAQGWSTIVGREFVKAFKDVLEGNKLEVSEEESESVLREYNKKVKH